jgi:predicted MFS family arabinose efflux permease
MGAAVSASQGWRGGYLVLAGAQLALAAVFLLTLRWWDRVPERTEAASLSHPTTATQTPTLGADSSAGWLSPALFALYAAVEATTGLWAATLLIVGRGISPATAAACTAGYYGAITGGRVLVGFVVDRWGNRRLVTGGAIVALVGAIVWTLGESPVAAATGLGLVGLGFAPVYPCLMHEVPRRFAPDAALVVIGRQSGAAYLGVAVLPAVAGVIAQHALPAVPWVVIGGIVVLIAGVRRLDRMT